MVVLFARPSQFKELFLIIFFELDNKIFLSKRNSILANCQIKCSIDHLCDGSRYPHQK